MTQPNSPSQSKAWIPDFLPPIILPDLLRMVEQTLRVEVEGYFLDLETLTPIKATLGVKHQGTFITVTAVADTIITLTCDRCLGQYNHRLQIDTEELIWLQTVEDLPLALPEEGLESDLTESLPLEGHFDLAQWLYEQLCLELPSQQRCGETCPGSAVLMAETATPSLDSRWATLAQLREQLPFSRD
jgi:uncharacterized protein